MMPKENALKAVLLSWWNGFYFCERVITMADKLQRCALAFQKLIDTQYEIDYTVGQAKYTLLYKKKINKTTGKSEIQYDKLSNK